MKSDALKLAAIGWHVFPAPVGTKKSHIAAARSGGPRWGATCDQISVAGHWSQFPAANIGVACGPSSGIWALDIDTPEGHDADGHASLRALIGQHGALPHTVASVSPTGSMHFYFRWPSDGGPEIRNSAGAIAPGIDTRGEGGMVIAPPSVKPDGRTYVWLPGCAPWDVPVADAPGWLLDSVRAVSAPRETDPRPQRDTPVELAELKELLDGIDPDAGSYEDWRAILAAIHQETGGSDDGLALADQWSERGTKYEPGEVEQKWSSFRVRPDGNGIGTIGAAHRAAGGDPGAIRAKHDLIRAARSVGTYRPAGMTDAPQKPVTDMSQDSVAVLIGMIETDPTADLGPLLPHVDALGDVDADRLFEAAKQYGLASALRRLLKSYRAEQRKARTADQGLVPDNNGAPVPNLENVRRIMLSGEEWAGQFQYNEFDRTIWIMRPTPRQATDNDFLNATARLQSTVFPSIAVQTVRDGITTAAAEQSFHPVRDYLRGLDWDGTPRLHKLFTDYFPCHLHGDIAGHAEFVAAAGQRFCIGAVARIMAPGAKVDTMPTLSGAQGLKKSTGVEALVGRDWYGGDMPGMDDKDAKQWLSGRWVAEMAELSAMKGKEVEHVKNFLSTATDRFRVAYGRVPETIPRQTVFFGTVNDDEYLADSTGGRRFWPLRVVRTVDVERIAAERDQLWAEAVALYDAGWKWWFDQGECPALSEMQESVRAVDLDETRIADWIRREPGDVTPLQIAAALFDGQRGDRALSGRIARYLKALGWEQSKKKEGVRYWSRTPRAEPYKKPEAMSGVVISGKFQK